MNSIIQFFYRLCVMFTVTIVTYMGFNLFINSEESVYPIFLQCMGLAILFTVAMTVLDVLSNKIKILTTQFFIWIEYLVLLTIIVIWAIIFKWGNWKSSIYICTFIGCFTLIYLIIYFILDFSNKKVDMRINEQLEKYKNRL